MKLKSQIESLLFISAKPMTASKLASLTKAKEKEVKKAGDELVEEYKNNKRGVQIIKNGSKYQMASAPENSKLIQEFVNDETTGELSRPSLETLTIIAYRGPISKANLDRIRGVNCSLILRNLLLRGLIEVKEDKSTGDSFYSVTFDFIRFLGINDVSELPDYEKLHKDETVDNFLAENEESDKEGAKNNEEKKETEDTEKKEEDREGQEEVSSDNVKE
jgi:segregation and condensation protein B